MKFYYFGLFFFIQTLTASALGNALTYEQVRKVADSISEIYRPISRQHDARLDIEIFWEGKNSEQINLEASQIGTTWFVHIFKGYISLKGMTEDAIALSLCHEVGHHFGGYPFKSSWASTEGQADYYANRVCTTLLWEDQYEENLLFVNKVDSASKVKCDYAYDSLRSRTLCYRKATAGLELANVMAHFSETEPIDTKKISSLPPVTETLFEHPSPQCRFETFTSAFLCPKEINLNKILGKTKTTVVPVPSEAQGSNKLWAAKESEAHTCSLSSSDERLKAGARPSCWFKPYFQK